MKKISVLTMILAFLCVTQGRLWAQGKFRVVSGGFNVSHSPVWAAYHQDIFKKYGLDVDYLAIESGSTAMQTLLAGEVQVLYSTGALAIAANLQGADLTIIAGGVNFLPYKLIVRPEIKTAEDLKGKTVAISRFGSSSELGMQMALEKLGVNPRHVTIIQAGGNTNRIAALSGRAVAGALVSEPHATLAVKNLGMHSFVDLGEIGTAFPLNCFIVKRTLLSASRDKALNFVKAVIEGLYSVMRNKPYALQLIKKYMRLDDEMAGIGYDYYLTRHGYELLDLPDKRGLVLAISLIAQQNSKAKGQTPESLRVLEPSILEEIKKSGFVEKLTK
ncbi:MAG: ABC transporter substrate-binding protein [Deltaproteobacteria bacterium]|nr:ABC transporter substrate-binding protein [Deltaproteobacteria bacterium]